MLEVAIIGGGLAGLSLAQQLFAAGIHFQLFEARQRFGGRILSHRPTPHSPFRVDLGPSWIWPDDQPLIAEFGQRYGLSCQPQWTQGASLYLSARESVPQRFSDPGGYAGAHRLKEGTQILIDTLLKQLPRQQLHLQHTLTYLKDQGSHIELAFRHDNEATASVKARHVALMLPPRLLAQHVRFEPALAATLLKVMQHTPTWMAGHAKAALQYEHPFWREQGLSGNAFAGYPGAILGEIFDSSGDTPESGSLSGFFALPAALRQQYANDLEALIRDQLVRLFGPEAAEPTSMAIQDWTAEPFTATALDHNVPDSHPDYGHPYFRLEHWSDKLYFGGSETSPAFGGYLEGALQSARFVFQQITQTMESRSCRTV